MPEAFAAHSYKTCHTLNSSAGTERGSRASANDGQEFRIVGELELRKIYRVNLCKCFIVRPPTREMRFGRLVILAAIHSSGILVSSLSTRWMSYDPALFNDHFFALL
jgi:hypothetical protein